MPGHLNEVGGILVAAGPLGQPPSAARCAVGSPVPLPLGLPPLRLPQKCLVKHKDIRKFLDGIYLSERGTLVKAE